MKPREEKPRKPKPQPADDPVPAAGPVELGDPVEPPPAPYEPPAPEPEPEMELGMPPVLPEIFDPPAVLPTTEAPAVLAVVEGRTVTRSRPSRPVAAGRTQEVALPAWENSAIGRRSPEVSGALPGPMGDGQEAGMGPAETALPLPLVGGRVAPISSEDARDSLLTFIGTIIVGWVATSGRVRRRRVNWY